MPETRTLKLASQRKQHKTALPLPVVLCLLIPVALWLACLAIMTYWRFMLHRNYPYNFPFFPVDHLYDLWCFTLRFKHLHSRSFFSADLGLMFQYPASASLIYAPLFLPIHQYRWFLGTTLLLLTSLGSLLIRRMTILGLSQKRSAGILSLTFFLSYPFWYEYIQANIEIFIFCIVALGICAFLSHRTYWAAALFGYAASAKLFPFVFFGLLICRKNWRETAFGIVVAITATLVGLWMLCSEIGFAYRGINAGLAANRKDIVLNFDWRAIGFDHSAFGFVKAATKPWFGQHYPPALLTCYLLFVSVVGLTLWFTRIRTLPLLNQVVALTVCAILLPPTSYEYTLLHMYVPWGLMVLYTVARAREKPPTKDLCLLFVSFGLLFSPLTEVIVRHHNASAQIKCCILVFILLLALRNRWEGIERLWNQEMVATKGRSHNHQASDTAGAGAS